MRERMMSVPQGREGGSMEWREEGKGEESIEGGKKRKCGQHLKKKCHGKRLLAKSPYD